MLNSNSKNLPNFNKYIYQMNAITVELMAVTDNASEIAPALSPTNLLTEELLSSQAKIPPLFTVLYISSYVASLQGSSSSVN